MSNAVTVVFAVCAAVLLVSGAVELAAVLGDRSARTAPEDVEHRLKEELSGRFIGEVLIAVLLGIAARTMVHPDTAVRDIAMPLLTAGLAGAALARVLRRYTRPGSSIASIAGMAVAIAGALAMGLLP
jgi:hypothetical protein